MQASSCEFYSHPEVKLKDHLSRTGSLCREYTARVVRDLKVIEAAEIIGKCHDLAKYTQFFQKHLRGEKVSGDLSKHSRLSAILTSWLINKKLNDPFLAAIGFLCVDSHHGGLKSFRDLASHYYMYLDSVIIKQAKSIEANLNPIKRELEENGISEAAEMIRDFNGCWKELVQALKTAYIQHFNMDERMKWRNYYTTLLLFSSLIDADKKDAGKVRQHKPQQKLVSNLITRYLEKKLKYAAPSPLNSLRNTIFASAERRLNELLNSNPPQILTVKAPTGSGKTLLGLYAALKLKEHFGSSRVVYCLPYINIVEQTYSVAEDVLMTYYGEKPDIEVLLKHHHLFFPSEEKEDIPLDKLLLLTDSWESELVITTFEQLLSSVIGCRNSVLKKFHNLVGSVLILDEVQAIPLEYWRVVRDSLQYLAETFDMRIILMTATMPVIFGGAEIVPESQTHFEEVCRTSLISQLEQSVSPEGFADFFLSKWDGNTSALLVLNTIMSSKRVYRRIAEKLDVAEIGVTPEDEIIQAQKPILAYLSTSVIPKERRKRIELLKRLLMEKRKVILVSTQVVEAGVDLDFDVAFRDLGPLDSIVQVAGRCNRNWRLKEGKVYVLSVVDENGYQDSQKIYGKILPVRTSEFIGRRGTTKERELVELLKLYYDDIKERMNIEKNPECDDLLEKIRMLDFQKLCNFSLIKEEHKVPVYIECDDEAKQLLHELNSIVKIIDDDKSLERRLEQRAQLRKVRAAMENYIVEIYESEPLLKGLKQIMRNVNVYYVSEDDFPAYYDPETGFRSEKDEAAFFVTF